MYPRAFGLGRLVLFCAFLATGCVSESSRRLSSIEGQSACGEIVSLTDARFGKRNAQLGLWRPADYVRTTNAGVYFIEPYVPDKTPVLFVHGINGSPAQFLYLLERLDRTRFQPWVYAYPSGAPLEVIADHLDRTITKLERRYRFDALAVIAHSMGGLVARSFILRHSLTPGATPIPLFMSLSTPWDGHASAALGVKHAPVVVDAWRDLVPGSPYLTDLFLTHLPEVTRHWLLFTFNRRQASFGESSDRSVSVASQLSASAQREAARVLGFDNTHSGVLRDAAVATLINEALTATFVSPRWDQKEAVAKMRAPP